MGYFDYRSPQQVAARVEEGESLGADPAQLNLVRALMSLGSNDNPDAISRLRVVPDDSSDAVRARYMLAWALWRTGERGESRATFDEAGALRPPQGADEWFFRGLASHFDRPGLAMEAYQRANALRAANQQFFPQAVLHLARAYNQEMYATRSDALFEPAQAILLQLIQQGHYKAYPHYLLSICQRLGGDILESRRGPDDGEAIDRFQAALDWARLGQTVDPFDDRPITAEAECLERLGAFDDAIDARTRAFQTSGGKSTQCEALHYRWRLHFWTGDRESAAADVSAHAHCAPQSILYAHVYPSWMAADAGHLERAIEMARAIAQEAPDDAQAVLWSAAGLHLFGRADEAREQLRSHRKAVRFDVGLVPPQNGEWVAAVYDMAAGDRSLDEVLRLADASDQPRKLKAEAYFHAAMDALGRGQRDRALSLLEDTVHCFDSEIRFTFHAKALWRRLEGEPNWPHHGQGVRPID
jgi:tetratricopeptide (TPR) repeat protein